MEFGSGRTTTGRLTRTKTPSIFLIFVREEMAETELKRKKNKEKYNDVTTGFYLWKKEWNGVDGKLKFS